VSRWEINIKTEGIIWDFLSHLRFGEKGNLTSGTTTAGNLLTSA